MQLLISQQARQFSERHHVIDRLRGQRESGDWLVVDPDAAQALLQEIDLLQVVAQAAEHVAAFPCGERADEPLAQLQVSLQSWKE